MKKVIALLLIASVAQGSLLQGKFDQLNKLPEYSKIKKACEQSFPVVMHNGKTYKRAVEMECDFLNKYLQSCEHLGRYDRGEDRPGLVSFIGDLLITTNLSSEEKIFGAVDTILSGASDEDKKREFDLLSRLSGRDIV